MKLGEGINDSHLFDLDGYRDNSIQVIQSSLGEIVNVELTPGYKSRSYNEFWRVWVDWNNNGSFEETEKVIETFGKNKLENSFTVPGDAVTSENLKIRISMAWRKFPESCANFENGKVIDYSINVNAAP